MDIFSRFMAVGIINTLLGYLIIFFCAYVLKFSPLLSNGIGYGFGLAISYYLNKKFTFSSARRYSSQPLIFFLVFIFSYGINIISLYLFIYIFGINDAISQIMAGIFYVATSFFLNKRFVFKMESRHEPL